MSRTTIAAALTVLVAPPVASQGWSDTPWHVECVDPPNCAPADEVYAQQLAQAAAWLSSLGFDEPMLLVVDDETEAYYVEVSDQETIARKNEPVGIYDPGSQSLYLASESYFTLGEDESTQFVPVHELFHAVQRSYQEGNFPLWIKEGMANAVLLAYTLQFEPELGAGINSRSFVEPLHLPASEEDAYKTWIFWLGIGRQLGSANDIAYLRDVLQEDFSEHEGLAGVDRGLPGGLVTHLPRLFAFLPIAPFAPENVSVQLPAGERYEELRTPLHVKEVAGKGAKVAVTGPAGRNLTVQFSLEPAHPDLHLIVDQKLQPEPLAVKQLPEGGSQTFEVVVANVAGKAIDTEPRDTDLVVTLMSGGCLMQATVSGDASGTFEGDVAYFNAFEDGQGVETGMAAGTAVDPGMHDQLQGLMEMMEGMAEWGESIGLELDEEVKAKMESEEGEDSEGMQEMKAWEQELLHSGDDTFGITLQALPGGGGQEDPSGLGGLAALMGSGFNMGISGQHYALQGPGLVGAISFEPSMAYATAGLTDGNLEGVKFLWEPGEPGYVIVTLTRPDGGPVVYGTVEAELHAEHTHPEGRPKIQVNATFAALQGFQSCMR